MNPTHTDITLVLDRSGSMAGLTQDTIGGVNRFLETQKLVPGSCTVTIRQFDHEHSVTCEAMALDKVEPLNLATYVPRGMTALFDGIGRAVDATGRRLSALPEAERPGKVIIVIVTDGAENASKEFTRLQIADKIRHQEEKYRWEFVFLGANQNAFQTGTGLGFKGSNSMAYADNSQGISAMYSSVAENAVLFRTCASTTMAFKKSDKAAQKAAGVADVHAAEPNPPAQ